MNPKKEKQFASENLPPEIQEKAERMNLDPAAVGPCRIPPLPLEAGVTGPEFQAKAAPRLIQIFRDNMYGLIPPRCSGMEFRLVSEGDAFGTLAVRREIDLIFSHAGIKRVAHMLLYLPKAASGKTPVIFGLNFCGNHTTTSDPDAGYNSFTPLPDWNAGPRSRDVRAPESARGSKSQRWSFEMILRAGIAAATICLYDFFPDRSDGFEASVMRMFYSSKEWHSPDRPSGAISAWAWGIMRALDCLEAQPEIDERKMIVAGHSRLGKTSLWAGACDPRIALAISNCSGCCGAKLNCHCFGESIEWIQQWNPHWMRADFERFVGHDAELPFDQHFLMAAIAPRLLFVASATEDCYADPEGEFLAFRTASEAWRIFGCKDLSGEGFPACGKLLDGGAGGYYLRKGEHNVTPENWEVVIEFIGRHFGNK